MIYEGITWYMMAVEAHMVSLEVQERGIGP